MSIDTLLSTLSARNMRFKVEEGKLFCKPDKNPLSESERAELKRHKQEIINLICKKNGTDIKFPASTGQNALWLIHQFAPESPVYNIGAALRIRSSIDRSALEKAFQTISDRHPCLRTTFYEDEGKLFQNVHAATRVSFECIDCSGMSETHLKNKVQKENDIPFDLTGGAAFRARLFSMSDNDHVLLIVMHHILSDGWSLWLVISELMQLYGAETGGAPANLSPLCASYRDYVYAQSEMFRNEKMNRHRAYWKKQLEGVEPVIRLPLDRARPTVPSYKGDLVSFGLDHTFTRKLRKIAGEMGVTMYMTLLSAFQVLLYRYSGQKNSVIGSPVLDRKDSRFMNVVGYFVNMVVMRADFTENMTFRDFLLKNRTTVIHAMKHQDYPFPLLIQELQIEYHSVFSPLVQTIFVYQNPQDGSPEPLYQDDDALPLFELKEQVGKFDIEFEVIDTGSKLLGRVKYSTDLFDRSTIKRMIGHFETLLNAISENPDQRIDDLELLTATEKKHLIVKWNKTEKNYPLDQCVHQLFEAQVEKTPDAVAAVFKNHSLTYAELNLRANLLAHYLREKGVGPDVLVGICVERSLEMIIGLLGIMKAGGAYVPMDPEYPKDRLSFMLEDSDADVLLTQEKFVEDFTGGQVNGKRIVFCLDRDWHTLSEQKTGNPRVNTNSSHLIYMLYTSGSTGKPKGAMNIHSALVNRLLWMQDECHLTPDDRVLQKTPFSFDVSGWEFFLPLLTGASVVFAEPGGHRDSDYLVRFIREKKITILHFVPSMLQIFLEEKHVIKCTSLKQVICSGEALPFPLQEKFFSLFSARLVNLYGPTEAAIDVTCWECKRNSRCDIVPIGRPIANTKLYILDNQLQPVPVGIPGELHIGGANLARGYWNRPDLTKEKFIPDPFSRKKGARLYKTGDLCRFLPDGVIEYFGRMDTQVKIRGFRIELGEIESLLLSHDTIKKAAVVDRDIGPGDKQLVAYIVEQEKDGFHEKTLRNGLKKSLPDYMIPAFFVLLDDLPLSPNGKIDRKALPEPERKRLNQKQARVAPRNDLEKILSAIWEDLLQIKEPGVTDNFFELGGHSLLAMKLIREIKNNLGKSLPPSILFEYQTIESLAEYLARDSGKNTFSHLVPFKTGGAKTPVFCIHPSDGSVMAYRELANHMDKDRPFYGLQARGLEKNKAPCESLEEMAEAYIKVIDETNREKPFILSGWSFGGMVAFEMARQLKGKGKPLKSLIIVDIHAMASLYPHDHDQADSERLATMMKGYGINIPKNVLNKKKTEDEKLCYILKKGHLLQHDITVNDFKRILDLNRCHMKAMEAYKLRLYDGRLTVIRAEDQSFLTFTGPLTDKTLGWDRFASDVTAIETPGNHFSMFLPPHVESLAAHIQKVIEETEENYGN